MLYVFLYHTPNPEKLQVFSHFPHKIHPKSGTNPHFLTTPLLPLSLSRKSHSLLPLSSSHSRKSQRRIGVQQKGFAGRLLCGPQGLTSGERKILGEIVFSKTRFQAT